MRLEPVFFMAQKKCETYTSTCEGCEFSRRGPCEEFDTLIRYIRKRKPDDDIFNPEVYQEAKQYLKRRLADGIK